MMWKEEYVRKSERVFWKNMQTMSDARLTKKNIQCRERREKHGKVEVKRKQWVLAQSPYSLQRNRRQSPGWKPMSDNSRIWHHQQLGGQARLGIFHIVT